MASTAMRLAILYACTDTFCVLIAGDHFEPRSLDHFSKRRAALALRQPAKSSARDDIRGKATCFAPSALPGCEVALPASPGRAGWQQFRSGNLDRKRLSATMPRFLPA